jgi:hypothetical protein
MSKFRPQIAIADNSCQRNLLKAYHHNSAKALSDYLKTPAAAGRCRRGLAAPEGCRHCGGVVVRAERRNLARAQREDHRPVIVVAAPRGLDAAALVPEDHDTITLGDELLRLELLDLFRLVERPEELPHLAAAAA